MFPMADRVSSGLIKDHNCDLVTRLALLLLELSEPSGCLRVPLTLVCSVTCSINPSGTDSESQAGFCYINFSNRFLLYPWVGSGFLLTVYQLVWGLNMLTYIFGSVVFCLGGSTGDRSGAELEAGAGHNTLRPSSSVLPCFKLH